MTFSETGLPANITWSVTLNGSTRSSSGPAIQFAEVDGRYSFSIGTVAGYIANLQSGSVTVNGGPVSQAITFSSATSLPSGWNTITFFGLPVWETAAITGIAVVVVALLLLGLLDCPDECKPKGAKVDCSSSITLEIYPCGQAPGSTKDLETGAEIMALGAKLAGKLEVFGETYGKMLEAMPGWIKAGGNVIGQKVGVEVYATVNCRWMVCTDVPCHYFWKKVDWTRDWRFWGPSKLTPPSGYAKSGGADCFGPGLDAGDLSAAIGGALDANEKVAEARRNCKKVCA
ncbi:MAG: hypothetical protein L3K14_04285 [Thermoplasmata archaeon]|nr:hypothetical protein [Thermoplasmata archaeon]